MGSNLGYKGNYYSCTESEFGDWDFASTHKLAIFNKIIAVND
ncbi:hypothetical protein [Pseudanabaena sp. Chao 1811]|nr:hypothetical protein [Pseudanabaena sp. Chao 1811]